MVSNSTIEDALGGSTDRRIRLRPKAGASSLYYGGLLGGIIANPTSIRQNLLSQALGDITSTTSWLSTSPLASQSPNAPVFFQQPIDPTQTLSVSNLIQDIVPATASGTPTNGLAGVVNQLSGNLTSQLFGNAPQILAPLSQTNGMIFPYTPNVNIVQGVDYSSYDPVHSNQEFHAYTRTRAPTITISGRFTAQNAAEASYALAAVHFCRVVAKMAFGQSQFAGTPPPILLLSGYGEFMLNDLPVIMTNFDIILPDDVDYVNVPNSTTYVPSIFTVSLSLTVQNTPADIRSFSLEQFRSGLLMKKKGWI